jgi:NAD(P)-dependent dehydrogenase (short-subunit alcohol dehydrogenase family)
LTRPSHTLVVGGTRGVGRAFAARAAAAGDLVSVLGRTKVEEAAGLAMRHFEVDVSKPDALADTLAAAVDRGPIRSAAFFQRYRGTGDAWEGELATTLTAARQVIEWMALPPNHTEAASIVVIGSSAARFIASEQPASYHVAKAALVQLVRFYAVNLGASGIRINAISSGTIVKTESREFYDAHPELWALYREILPLGRMCTADDIVDAAMFLLSPRASFITGQNIMVDGGLSLVWQESLARRMTALKDLVIVSDKRRSD